MSPRGVHEWRFNIDNGGDLRQDDASFDEPALATSVGKGPTGGRRIYEIKFDGRRMQVHLADEGVPIFTRRG